MRDGDKTKAKARGKLKGSMADQKAQAKSRLQRLAHAVGNDEIMRRIQQGNVSRDMMLAFIGQHLREIRELQIREQELCYRTAHWDWWRSVADAYKPWISKPEPMRWRETAMLYEQALKKICQGEIGPGRQLLEKAIQEEQRAKDKMTDLVDTRDLEFDSKGTPDWLVEISVNAAAGAVPPPNELRLIDEILNVNDEIPDPMNRRRRRDPWWTLEDEDEEEEGLLGGFA